MLKTQICVTRPQCVNQLRIIQRKLEAINLKFAKHSVLYYGIWECKCDYSLAFKNTFIVGIYEHVSYWLNNLGSVPHTGMGPPTILPNGHQA